MTSTLETRPVGDVIYTITRDYNFKDDDKIDTQFKIECTWEDGGDAVFKCDEDSKAILNNSAATQQNQQNGMCA